MKITAIEVAGFWSFREQQRIEIGDMPLLVGVGENGAGKSTLLVSAVAAALYGKFPTRTVEESITTGAKQGFVAVEFALSDSTYRVTRTHPRSGSASGVVMVADEEFPTGWRPVTEKGLREVTAYDTELLGMGFDTAARTWFAEQGQYGRFTGATLAERFKLLSTVFGLDSYAARAQAALEKVRAAQARVDALEAQITELVERMLVEDEADAPGYPGNNSYVTAAVLTAATRHRR